MGTNKWIKDTFILQQGQSDCGIACLASIIRYYQGDVTLESLRFMSGTNKRGTTLLGLYKAAMNTGLTAEGLEAGSIEDLRDLKGPAILHLILENKLQHFVVFYGFIEERNADSSNSQRLLIGDPSRGIRYYSADELNKNWQTKSLLNLRPNASFVKSKHSGIRQRDWILELVKMDIPILVVSLLIGIFVALLGLSTAIFSQRLIDEILPEQNSKKLFLVMAILTFLLISKAGLDYLRGFFILKQGIDFNSRVIQKFFNSLLYLPKLFFDSRKTGEFIARMNDTERIQQVVSSITGGITIDLLILLVSISVIFGYSILIGVFSLSVLPLYAWMAYSINNKIIFSQKDVMSAYALAESNYIDTLQGISAIKAGLQENFFGNLNKRIYSGFQEMRLNLGKLNIRFNFLSEAISILFLITVFGLSSWFVLEKRLQLGEMVALITLAAGIVPSVNRLVLSNVQIQGARVAFDRMFEFASISPESGTNDETVDERLVIENLRLKSVSFGFPGNVELLKNVSLQVRRGEIVSLLGESGGGKSTLLQLIQKFYEPETGEIIINDSWNLAGVPTRAWRRLVGFVPQDVKLFNGTVLFNLCLSEKTEDLQSLIQFCRTYGFEDYFNSFPQGYYTIVGEEGINLSGGQKQLIGIARVLFTVPELLIIDEGTSAMDRNTENFVLEVLTKLKGKMAILMATHKIKIAGKSDMIYIMRNGAIECDGSPLELLKFSNMYSDSYCEMVHAANFSV